MKIIKYIGLDVHKNSISISKADAGRDAEVRYYGKIGNDMDQLMKVFRKFISKGFELRCVYEAGCCGYHLYRFLTGNGVKCVIVAPSKIPRKSGDRLKNDTRDSITLTRLHRAGELTEVYVPAEEDEALRDLVRAREDAQNAHKNVTTGEKLPHLIEEDEPTYSCLYSVWQKVITDVVTHFSKLVSRGMLVFYCVTGAGAGHQVGGRGIQPDARRRRTTFLGDKQLITSHVNCPCILLRSVLNY